MRRHTLGLAISAILAPSLSYALGLGEISTNSALNQPLDAEIELVSTSPGEVDNVTVKLAPNAVFDQVGIERTRVLDGLQFRPTVINGVPVIKVTSGSGIQEPFINFVIEVAWPKGKLLREYTVLLDPPVLSDQGGQPPFSAPAPAPAPVAVAEPPLPVPAPLPTPEPSVAQAETYPVAEALPTPQPVPAEPVTALPDTYPVAESVDTVPMSETFSVAEAVEGGRGIDAFDTAAGLPPFVDSGVAMSSNEPQPLDEEGVQALDEPAPMSVADSQPVFIEPQPLEEADAGIGSMPLALDDVGTSEIFVSEGGSAVAALNEETFPVEEPLPLGDEPIFVSGGEPFVESLDTGYAGGDSYTVNRGDTLSKIARELRADGVSMNRMMAAFAQVNPGAFSDNSIHKLKAGYVLRIPDAAVLAEIDAQKASDIIANKGGAWQQYKTAMADQATPQVATDAAKDAAEPAPAAEPAAPETQAADSTAAGLDNLAATEPREVEEAKTPGLEIVSPEGEGEGGEAQGNAEAEAAIAQADLLKEQLESQTEEAEELRSRVAELEALLAAKDRLIDLKDQQLAEMQSSLDDSASTISRMEADAEEAAEAAKVAAAAATEAAVEPVKGLLPDGEQEEQQAEQKAEMPETETPAATTELTPSEQPEEAAAEEEMQPAAETAAEATSLAATDPEPAAESETAEAPAAEEESSSQNPRNLLLGGGAGLLLLALLAWWSSRRKAGDEEEMLYDSDEVDSVKTVVTETTEKPAEMIAEAEAEADVEVATEFDNELATGQFDSVDLDAGLEDTSHSIQIDSSELNLEDEEIGEDLTSVDIDLNEDEVLSEANVYLAYGLHDQAIDLLKPVVEANPERMDYQAKLAEAYHATGDKSNFGALAERMHGNISSNDDAMWQRTAVMGKDLLPDHELFKDVDTGDLTLSNIRKDRPDLADLDLDDMPDLEDAEATLSIDKPDLKQEGEQLSGDLSEEFQLPELDELDTATGSDLSLAEADLSQQINREALGELGESLPEESQLMEENLTLAEMENELSDLTTGADHIGTKLDLAKAYIDMGDEEGAREALTEVISQGSDDQQGEAKKLLSQLS